MAQRKRKPAAVAKNIESSPTAAVDKIAGLLALIATRDMDTDVAALKLDAIGFSSREISALLNVGSNYVAMVRHREKTSTKKSKKKA